MNAGIKRSVIETIEDLIRIGVMSVLAITVVFMGIALIDHNKSGEASIGSFEAWDFDSGWTLIRGDETEKIRIPYGFDMALGNEVTIVNTLPDRLDDGMSLMIRSSMEDIYIYIDGDLREAYASELIEGMAYYIPSAYIVADLDAGDSGKEIKIFIRAKDKGVINGVTIGHGNNVWFSVIKEALAVNLIAVVVLILGVLLSIGILFFRRSFKANAAQYLGLLMIDIGLWVISESTLRQFIFNRPSLSQYFAYFSVELVGVLGFMYFDEVQHREYHKRYLIIECIVFGQLILNIILHAAGVAALYQTMKISHIETAAGALVCVVNIVTDIIKKRVKTYRFTLVGMICFLIMALCELIGFYVNRFHIFGPFLCIAMILLMGATVIQTVYDEMDSHIAHEKKQTAMTIATIETIASAIDARDEYTGGHSERVGLYAGRLAREMAAEYELSEEDILRVHYIGLIHDIGKIGVADTVLNKPGRLSDEEVSLMKKHPEIGYEIMSPMEDGIEGLLDGIRYHHERFDGKGYPDGLSDTDIPLVARILALADSYDAMTSNRVYRRRLTDAEVKNELIRCSGTQFDPALTEIFLRLIDAGELKAGTVEGLATDGSGNVRNSSVLENRLQKDLLAGENIENPSHVRMLCYIMKLMEKKGVDYQILFMGPDKDLPQSELSEAWNGLGELIRENIGPHDVNIRYTDKLNIIALYDSDSEGTDRFIKLIKDALPRTVAEGLVK